MAEDWDPGIPLSRLHGGSCSITDGLFLVGR